MPDLDDVAFAQLESRTRKRAHALIMELHPMSPLPYRDTTGKLRHGYGRQIESVPITQRVATLALTEELIETQKVLRGRIIELVATHPESESRLPYLVAIADLMGAERMRDWGELWSAMRRQDWRDVGAELMTCQWDRFYGETPDKRRAVIGLVMQIMQPEQELAA